MRPIENCLCGDYSCQFCQVKDGLRDWSGVELVNARAQLVAHVEAIDTRLRELDGRATAGHPSLRVESEKA